MPERSETALPLRVRKLPVEVEAMEFTSGTFEDVREWLGDAYIRVSVINDGVKGIRLRTLEGRLEALDGDYIVKGVRGEFYPVKPDIFRETYEVLS